MLSVYKHIFKQSDEIEDVKLPKRNWVENMLFHLQILSEITLKEFKKKMQLQNLKERGDSCKDILV